MSYNDVPFGKPYVHYFPAGASRQSSGSSSQNSFFQTGPNFTWSTNNKGFRKNNNNSKKRTYNGVNQQQQTPQRDMRQYSRPKEQFPLNSQQAGSSKNKNQSIYKISNSAYHYKCPSCKKPFDYYQYYKNTHVNFQGNMPLILPCKHTTCEECIKKSLKTSNQINCGICSENITLKKDHHFDVNHYVLGHIMISKRSQNSSLDFLKLKLENEEVSSSKCNYAGCKKTGTSYCSDCSSHFCGECDENLHRDQYKSHSRSPMFGKQMHLELTECKIKHHQNSMEDLYCGDCRLRCCCYCFLENHEGHQRIYLALLNDEEEAELKRAQMIAEEKLRSLEAVKKTLEQKEEVLMYDIDYEIGKEFADLHTKLYLIETKIREEAKKIKFTRPKNNDISREVNSTIETIKHLLISLNRRKDVKLDLKKILTEIKEIENFPTHLIEDENGSNGIKLVVDEKMKELDSYFRLDVNENGPYRLIEEIKKTNSESVPHQSEPKLIRDKEKNHKPKKMKKLEKIKIEPLIVDNRCRHTSEKSVIITNLNSLKCFHVRYKFMEPEFESMNQEIEEHVAKVSELEDVELNKFYLAPLIDDENRSTKTQWARALVNELFDNGKSSVEYIDYGRKGLVNNNDLKHIPWSIADKDPFAYKCKLNFPFGCEWKEESYEELMKILHDFNEVKMIVKETVLNTLIVDLYISTSSDIHSIAELLICGCDILRDDEDSAVFVEKSRLFDNSDNFEQGNYYDVYIRHIENPWKIYIHKAVNENIFVELLNSLEHHYEDSDCDLHFPTRNTDIVVYYETEEYGNWHRGRVLERSITDKTVEVFLLDIGKTVMVGWKDTRKLVGTFRRIECLSMAVKLADICSISPDWDGESVREFLKEYSSRNVLMKILVSKTDPLEVILFKMQDLQNININALLVENHLAVSTGKLSETLKWMVKPEDDVKPKEDDGFLPVNQTTSSDDDTTEDDVSKDTKWPVEIINFENPHSIYVTLKSKSEDADKLHEELQIHYRQARSPVEKIWTENSKVVVLDDRDNFYYRGIIRKINGENYHVYLYDKGDLIVVKQIKLREIKTYFLKTFWDMTMKVHLHSIKPAGDAFKWSNMAIEWFQRILKKHKNFYVEIVEKDKNLQSTAVTMWYSKIIEGSALEPSYYRYISIDRKLVNVGLALWTKRKLCANKKIITESSEVPSEECTEIENELETEIEGNDDSSEAEVIDTKISRWLSPIQIKEKIFRCTITCAEIEGFLYVRHEKYEKDYELMELSMKKYFDAHTEQAPFDLCENQVVTIRYDDSWYRGVVVKIIDENLANVYMIDFGSDHDIEIDNLYQAIMYPEVPPFVSKIQLYDVHSKRKTWKDEDIEKLIELAPKHAKIIIRSTSFDTPEADVYDVNDETDESLNDKLVAACSNLYRKYSKKTIKPQDENEESLEIEIKEFNYVPLPELMPGQKIELEITALFGPKTLSLFIDDGDNEMFDEFKELSDVIQIEAPNLEQINRVKIGLPCICQYSEDNEWYRAKVLEYDSDVVTVFYVDYGNFEVVDISYLRKIKDEWLDFPAKYHVATIAYTLKDERYEDIITNYLQFLAGKTALIEIIDKNPLRVHVYKNDDSLFYESFVKRGALKID